MITEKKLQYFIEICKTENISLAARNLFIAQPALSKTIQELEEELHYPLFDRQGKHIILNENGRIFQTYAKQILADYDGARAALMANNQTDDKHISFGVSVCSQLLSDILGGFYEKRPDANITVHTGYPLNCMQDHMDLILDAYPQLTTPSSDQEPLQKPAGDILMSEEICIAYSASHPFAREESIPRSILYHYPCILPSSESRMGDLLDDLWQRYILRPLQSSSEVNNSYVQCELVSQGRYFTLVPQKSWRPAYTANNLILAPLPDAKIYRHICLYRQPYLSPLALEFADYLHTYFAAL